jgi:protoheme IX farnesyltransferase
VAVGLVSVPKALSYAAALGLCGMAILAVYTKSLTVTLGLVALFSYVVLYGFFKRRSVHGTLIGTVPGAASIVAGYTAVSGRLDMAALILFLMLVFWQMAHFYSIAIYRLEDYESANIPVLPAKNGVFITKAYILIYIMAFTAAAFSLSAYGYANYGFGVVMAALGLAWLALGIRGFNINNYKRWARQMFKFSLIAILSMSVMLSLDSIL